MESRSAFGVGVALVAACVTSGCSYLGTARDFDPQVIDQSTEWTAIREVPEIRQKEAADCGVAALAMVLGYWTIPCSERKAAEVCPIIPGQGTKAGDLRDGARQLGLEAYLIHGEVADLLNELREKRPILVGLLKPHTGGAWTHYEVVVGFHPEKYTVLTIDPGHGWRQNTLEGFLGEWEPTGRLTLVVFRNSPQGSSPGGAPGLPQDPGKISIPEGTEDPPRRSDCLLHEPYLPMKESFERRTP